MKHLIIIIFLFMLGCENSSWNKNDQENFIQDCVQAVQSDERCDCLLQCLINEYSSYSEATKMISSEKISGQLNVCIERCN
jgi:hypothetical protein